MGSHSLKHAIDPDGVRGSGDQAICKSLGFDTGTNAQPDDGDDTPPPVDEREYDIVVRQCASPGGDHPAGNSVGNVAQVAHRDPDSWTGLLQGAFQELGYLSPSEWSGF